MYYEKEIKGGRKYWTVWLEAFAVGETKEADSKDRSKIAISIANNFHKSNRAKFSTKVKPGDPFVLLVTRER